MDRIRASLFGVRSDGKLPKEGLRPSTKRALAALLIMVERDRADLSWGQFFRSTLLPAVRAARSPARRPLARSPPARPLARSPARAPRPLARPATARRRASLPDAADADPVEISARRAHSSAHACAAPTTSTP